MISVSQSKSNTTIRPSRRVTLSSSGLGDHDFAGIEADEAAGPTDTRDHVAEVISRPAPHVQDRVAGGKRGPFEHESLACLNRRRPLRLIHEAHEEIGIGAAIDVRKELGMRPRAARHDPVDSAA